MAEKVREADAHSPTRWPTGRATSSCLSAEILSTAAAFSPTRHHHQATTGSWRWRASPPGDDWFVGMARLVALRYGGESASAPGCLCNGTGTFYRLFYAA